MHRKLIRRQPQLRYTMPPSVLSARPGALDHEHEAMLLLGGRGAVGRRAVIGATAPRRSRQSSGCAGCGRKATTSARTGRPGSATRLADPEVVLTESSSRALWQAIKDDNAAGKPRRAGAGTGSRPRAAHRISWRRRPRHGSATRAATFSDGQSTICPTINWPACHPARLRCPWWSRATYCLPAAGLPKLICDRPVRAPSDGGAFRPAFGIPIRRGRPEGQARPVDARTASRCRSVSPRQNAAR